MKKKPRLFLLDVLAAVYSRDCQLPEELRSLVTAMARAADHQTGVGIAGQTTLAGEAGVSVRTLYSRLAALEEAVAEGRSPVRITRVARFRKAGRGRTSDAYQIELINRQAVADCSSPPTGKQLPVSCRTNRQTDARLIGKPTSTNRQTVAGHISNERSNERSDEEGSPPPSKKTRSRKSWRRVPTDWVLSLPRFGGHPERDYLPGRSTDATTKVTTRFIQEGRGTPPDGPRLQDCRGSRQGAGC